VSKKIQINQEVYIAPKMLGKYENGQPIVIDEKNNNTKLNPNILEDKIKIYEREVEEWFLKPTLKLLNDENVFNNSFLILMTCMSYIEGVEQYKKGSTSNRNSKVFFISSMNEIFPNQFKEGNINKLYSDVRNGLFHNGMSKSSMIFNNTYIDALKFEDNGIIRINPTKFLKAISNDFSNYVQKLNDTQNTELRSNFNNIFTVLT